MQNVKRVGLLVALKANEKHLLGRLSVKKGVLRLRLNAQEKLKFLKQNG